MSRHGRPYHHADLRAALVDALLAALEAGEADGLTMRELAARIGVSHTAAYAHFAGKAALLDKVAGVGFARLRDALAAAIGEAARPADRIVAAGAAYLHFARTSPALYRLMFRPGHRARPDPERRGEAAFGVLLEAIAALGAGSTPGARVHAGAIAAWSLVHGFACLENGGDIGSGAPGGLAEPERYALMTLVRGLAADWT